ncbi:MAG: hypothetical protein H0V88_15495 [Pyrinomonadaceae bacterium]|nr:hypothetical protein [Pyrinomonadaceae bacterium]
MISFLRGKNASVYTVVALLAALVMASATALAHGGEDHGEKQAPAVSTGTGMVAHTARVGDLEIVIKHTPVEPDKETAARLFLTHYATNEPIGGAKLVIVLASESGVPVEVAATAAGTTPGMYEAKLPPLPKGQYKLAARVVHDGKTETAEYGVIGVAPQPVQSIGSVATWARTALIILAAIIGLGLGGAIIYRMTLGTRRERIKRETATA